MTAGNTDAFFEFRFHFSPLSGQRRFSDPFYERHVFESNFRYVKKVDDDSTVIFVFEIELFSKRFIYVEFQFVVWTLQAILNKGCSGNSKKN